MGCIGNITLEVFSSIFGSSDGYRRILKPYEEKNLQDSKDMIDKVLDRIDQEELFAINRQIEELVKKTIENLPQELTVGFELKSEDDQVHPQDPQPIREDNILK